MCVCDISIPFYSTQVYCLGTILSMQISFVGFQPVQSSEHMAVWAYECMTVCVYDSMCVWMYEIMSVLHISRLGTRCGWYQVSNECIHCWHGLFERCCLVTSFSGAPGIMLHTRTHTHTFTDPCNSPSLPSLSPSLSLSLSAGVWCVWALSDLRVCGLHQI